MWSCRCRVSLESPWEIVEKLMAEWDGDDEKRWSQDVARSQRRPAAPQRIADVLSRLMSRRGYAQLQSSVEWGRLWQQAAGSGLAKDSRAGNIRGGVLEIVVRNSSVAQELAFQKKQLLRRLRELVSGYVIEDLRFRVGDME